MRTTVFVALFLCAVFGQTVSSLKSLDVPSSTASEVGTVQDNRRFDPMIMNRLNNLFYAKRRTDEVNDIADQVNRMSNELYYRHDPIAPRQRPALEPLLKDVVKSLHKVQKRTTKQGSLPKAKENMEMFNRLLDSVSHINKRLDPKPAPHTNAQRSVRNNEIQKLLYIPQPQEETEDQQAMHERSHAQSRMLHRLTHSVDRLGVNTQADLDRKIKYDRVLNDLMHQHLNNPVYHDDLHDHLMAHHLITPHSDDAYNEHLAQHMLYHDVGRNAENEFLHSTPKTAPTQTLSLQQQHPDLLARQQQAATTNHLYGSAEQREAERRNMANTFAQVSFDKYKSLKPIGK